MVTRYWDAVGNVSDPVIDMFGLDMTPPTGSVTVNDGAGYTSSPSVTLVLSATDEHGIAGMAFSNDWVTFSEWVLYTTPHSRTLVAGDGTKTIYARLCDNAGNSAAFSDTIILDTRPPVSSEYAERVSGGDHIHRLLGWVGYRGRTVQLRCASHR